MAQRPNHELLDPGNETVGEERGVHEAHEVSDHSVAVHGHQDPCVLLRQEAGNHRVEGNPLRRKGGCELGREREDLGAVLNRRQPYHHVTHKTILRSVNGDGKGWLLFLLHGKTYDGWTTSTCLPAPGRGTGTNSLNHPGFDGGFSY